MTGRRPYGIGRGLTLLRNIISVDESEIDHNSLNNFVANEHIDWTQAEADFFTSGNVTIEGDVTISGDVNFSGSNISVSTVAYTATVTNSFKAGNVIYFDGTNFQLAHCKTEEAAESVGIVIEASTTQFKFVLIGVINLSLSSVGLNDNTTYFLSSSPGHLSTEKPNVENYVIKPFLKTLNNNRAVIFNHRGIVREHLVKDENDMASNSNRHMATQRSIKAYADNVLLEAENYTDTELSDYADDTVVFTNKTIDADNNTISNLEHGAEVDAPAVGSGVTHGHVDDGSQTIYGEKTFNTFPITPSAAPDADYEVANKKYVDDNTGAGTDTEAVHDNIAGEINAITAKATPIDADLLLIEDSADTYNKKKITIGDLPGGSTGDMEAATYDPRTIEEDIYPLSGAGAPSSTPDFLGQRYLDTTAKRWYIATGTTSSADWDKEPVYYTTTGNFASGGGDETINLPWDWTDGYCVVIIADSSTDWADNNSDKPCKYETSYDALTNSAYSNNGHSIQYINDVAANTNIQCRSKTENQRGMPKSATSTTIVLDDGSAGVTNYYKIFVWA